MKFSITFRNMRGDANIIGHIDHRLSFAFSKTQHRLNNVIITLTNISKPQGINDKECHVAVALDGYEPVVVTERQSDMRQAIDRCLRRASQSVNRRLGRKPAKPQSSNATPSAENVTHIFSA